MLRLIVLRNDAREAQTQWQPNLAIKGKMTSNAPRLRFKGNATSMCHKTAVGRFRPCALAAINGENFTTRRSSVALSTEKPRLAVIASRSRQETAYRTWKNTVCRMIAFGKCTPLKSIATVSHSPEISMAFACLSPIRPMTHETLRQYAPNTSVKPWPHENAMASNAHQCYWLILPPLGWAHILFTGEYRWPKSLMIQFCPLR